MVGARRKTDVGAMSSAVSRPGIDPRVWLTLAVVKELGFSATEGCFADVQFQPGGENETAYYGTSYAGSGFGEHNPIEVGDTVLVALPMGDPGLGPIIIARFNNAGDPPPAEFGEGDEPSADRIVRVKPNQNLRIIVSGTGSVNITVEGAGQVTLGGEAPAVVAPLQGVVQGEAIDPFTGLTQFALGNASTVVAARKF